MKGSFVNMKDETDMRINYKANVGATSDNEVELGHVATSGPQNGSAWCDFWATACHNLWIWRNKELHDDDFVRPMYAVQYVSNKVEDYMQAKKATEVLRCREVVSIQIGWIPPTRDRVKLNTDGARKHNNIAWCGGIIRGSQGEWLGGFAKGVGNCSAFVAELWGVYEGLSYARRLGFMKVELNIDSVTVVNVLTKGTLQSLARAMLVRNIRSLIALDWEVSIVHAYRESNQCADALVNIGCTLDKEIIVYDDCPSEIKDLLLADVLGITTPRLLHV
ncbi:ribonuclease H [Trifolium pratense]|uniref:Ribonuclease H n=1 Tax=Trifolium pratense TaxID=57577 RepID=A0A2K3NCD6_TRIPR|nr:ribonuclease H [Trifolium pratense]